MTLNVEQGRTIRLPADFFSGDIPCDPTDPRLHVLNPSNDPVATRLVPNRKRPGVYYYDFRVAPDAPVGLWTAKWTGTINGELVGGDDKFDVLRRTSVETEVSPGRPAGAYKLRPSSRTEAQSGFKFESLAGAWSSSAAESAPTPAPRKRWGGAVKVRAGQKEAKREEPIGLPKERPGGRLRTSLLVAILVLIVVGAAVYIHLAQKAAIERSFDLADVAFQNGRFDEAQLHYFDVVEKDPENKFAHFNLGILAQRGNRLAEAQYYYGRALAEDPDFLPALYNKASILEAAGNSSEAAKTYRHLLKTSPGNAPSHFNLGLLLYFKLGDPVEGKKEISEALKLDPGLTSKLDPNLAVQIPPPNQPSP